MSFNRTYYKAELTLESPLSIGSGADENTDKDVILDSTGKPFIPATSLAGVLKSYIASKHGRAAANAVFGFIPTSKEEKDNAKKGDRNYIERESAAAVYDGYMTPDKDEFFITNRDMVALKDKVGIKGAKFDMEAVEPGSVFTAFVELLVPGEITAVYKKTDDNGNVIKDDAGNDVEETESFNAIEMLEEAFAALNSGALRLGTKTSRGYGKVSAAVKKVSFTDVDKWLEFDMDAFDNESGVQELELKESPGYKINVELKLCGGISIREYTTDVSTESETMPDYRTMGLHIKKENGKPVPVIPGTSWAGAFRDRFLQFTDNKAKEKLFGFVHNKKIDGDDKVSKSRIVFSESRLSGGEYKNITRNSIDRFSGATKDGALYTETTYYNGSTVLEISLAEKPDETEIDVLCACLADLHNGFLAVGGLTSIGRGLFEITAVNGKKVTEEDKKPDKIYPFIKGVLTNA